MLNAVLPLSCPLTGEPVGSAGALSAAAWEKIRFIDDPVCARCGAPFAVDYGPGSECAGCVAEPPVFDRARAGVVYDEASHALIVGFKHADRTDLGPLLGRWLARAGAGIVTSSTILAPVPLHRRRLFARRFNQSAELAQRLARDTGARFAPLFFERLRATPSQKGMSADQRRRNLAGAIGVRAASASVAAGAHVVIIDDVMTTGSTLNACARAARKAGASKVDALVLARAMKDTAALG
jgi:ComF family protein